MADDDPWLAIGKQAAAARPAPADRRPPFLIPDDEAAARAGVLLRELPAGYQLTRADAAYTLGRLIHRAIVFTRASGAGLALMWQSLSYPVPLWSLTFASPEDRYERGRDGTEVVITQRNAPYSYQVIVVHPDGGMCNGIANGIPGRGVPAPMGASALRRLVERHATAGPG